MNDLEILIDIAKRAGALALSDYGLAVPSEKPDRSFVTEADKKVEEFLRMELGKAFFGVEVLGEEVETDVSASVAWVIDPIDGTANFVAGIPIWAVCISLVENGVPVLGAVNYPAFGELYVAQKGKGAFLNGTPIRARQDEKLHRDDLLGLSTETIKQMEVRLPCKVRSLGTAVACFTFVAKGAFIGGLLTDHRVWDIAAGLCIANEAGAEAIDFTTGKPITPLSLTRKQLPPQLVAPPQFIPMLQSGIHLR